MGPHTFVLMKEKRVRLKELLRLKEKTVMVNYWHYETLMKFNNISNLTKVIS